MSSEFIGSEFMHLHLLVTMCIDYTALAQLLSDAVD
jgi:hypothetical protein